MNSSLIYTRSGLRLSLRYQAHKPRFNLVLIPGGPGMGAEYFESLVLLLKSEYTIWTIDLPGNGNNHPEQEIDYLSWSHLLLEVFDHLENVIFLGHSFGGMLLLDCPAIEAEARALILMSTVPESIFNEEHDSYLKDIFVKRALVAYSKNPSDQSMKNLLIQLAPLYFEPEYLEAGIAMFKNMHCSYRAYDVLKTAFLKTYRARYIPKIPTLIISGEEDVVTPLKHFAEHPEFCQPPFTVVSIPKANHFPWVNNPDATGRALLTWLERLFG